MDASDATWQESAHKEEGVFWPAITLPDNQTSIDLTASFGGATIMPKRETMNSERLLANAEKALRDAKSVGNTIRWWHSANK